jgi:tetratricopeptide (TPR) repeat protein
MAPEAAGTLAIVNFDEDLDRTRQLLSARPLATTCGNCRTVFDSFIGFIFLSEGAFVVAFVPTEAVDVVRAELESKGAKKIVVSSDLGVCTDAVRSHLQQLATEVLVPLKLASASGHFEDWVHASMIRRRCLSAAWVLYPVAGATEGVGDADDETAHLTRIVARLAGVSVLLAASDALRDQVDVLEHLDSAARPEVMDGDALQLLTEAASSDERPFLEKLGAAVALAWWSDRMRTPLEGDAAESWAWWALGWATELERPNSPFPDALVDDGFLQRTVVPIEAAHAIAACPDKALGMRMARKAAEKGLLGPIDLSAHMRIGNSAEEERTALLAGASKATHEHIGIALKMLADRGLIDDAKEVYRKRRDELLRTDEGAFATAEIVKALWRGHRPKEAREIGDDFLRDSGPDVEAWASAETAVALFTELGNVSRQFRDYERALSEYEAALSALPQSSLEDEQERIVARNIAIVFCNLGYPRKARPILLELLQDERDPLLRSQLLDTLGHCFLQTEDYEAGQAAFEEGLEALEPVSAAFPEARLHPLLNLASTMHELGDEEGARVLAEEAVGLAEMVGDHFLTALGATVLASTHKNRELLQEALAAVSAARQAGVSEVRAALLNRMEAGLLADSGATNRLLELIRAEGGHSWELNALAAQVVGEERGWRAARGYLEHAWSLLFEELCRDDLAPGDISALRNARSLQRGAAELALAELRDNGDAVSDVLGAAELSASLVSGLLAWPADRRREAASMLLEPERLLEAIDPDVMVVVGVEGFEQASLLALTRENFAILGEWPTRELQRTVGEVEAVTKRAPVGTDPLAKSERWSVLAAEIGRELSKHVDDRQTILFTPGPAFAGIPLHAVSTSAGQLCLYVPFAYAASLVQLAGLKQRRAAREERIQRAGVLSVPRVNDRDETKSAFASGATDFRTALERYGVAVSEFSEEEGTSDRFRELCSSVDLLYIACHGLAQPGYGIHAFLLAHRGQLPPMLVQTAESDDLTDAFLVSWDEIGAQTPPHVISAACSSGSASFAPGGERVALDRAFLAGTTHLFFGPLWDVSVREAQELVTAVADRVLSGGESWAHSWLDVLTDASESVSASTWQSFALFGDWR